MRLTGLVEEDFTQYKKPSMFIGTSKCDFKCCKECGKDVCQNINLSKASIIEIDNHELIKRYLNNSITNAIVFGGLDPFCTFEEVYDFIKLFRDEYGYTDDIVIYTGYKENEVCAYIDKLKKFKNIIVKFGRYVPGRASHYDSVLGVYLANEEQYALKLR